MDTGMLIREARRGARLSQAELAARAGTSQPAVARYETGRAVPTLPTLERLLLECGLRPQLTTVRAVDTPLAQLVRDNRRRLRAAARRHGIRNVRVFGSVARREDSKASDVDLLVDLDRGRTLLDLAAFRCEASDILGAPVDVATLDMLKDRIRPAVVTDAVRL